jgi:tRNA(Ile)-lysidine synthase
VARDEEAWWARELARVQPGILLPGKPVRGGGRANSTRPGEVDIAMELERLRALHPALQRRVLRAAAGQLGFALSFDQTEALRTLAEAGEHKTGKRGRIELEAGLIAERALRELRLVRRSEHRREQAESALPELIVPVPGVLEAVEYGCRVHTEGKLPAGAMLVLRTPRAGDRVRLPHSRGVKTVKEVLERRGLSVAERKVCPVLAVGSGILWMRGVEVEWTSGLQVSVEPLRDSAEPAVLPVAPNAT